MGVQSVEKNPTFMMHDGREETSELRLEECIGFYHQS